MCVLLCCLCNLCLCVGGWVSVRAVQTDVERRGVITKDGCGSFCAQWATASARSVVLRSRMRPLPSSLPRLTVHILWMQVDREHCAVMDSTRTGGCYDDEFMVLAEAFWEYDSCSALLWHAYILLCFIIALCLMCVCLCAYDHKWASTV